MVRFVIYKNSVLATICSMIGAVCIVMAVGGLVGKEIGILPAIAMIGITTFLFSALGIKIGNQFGARYRSRAELAGGLILILMGVLILLEDLGVLR